MKEVYNSPEILDQFTNSEPVETGCCLRSCGGSPHHVDGDTQLDEVTENKFRDAIEGQSQPKKGKGAGSAYFPFYLLCEGGSVR